MRALAAALATVLFWMPLAPRLARAQDGEEPAESSVVEGRAFELSDEAREQLAGAREGSAPFDPEAVESALDRARAADVPGDETTDTATPVALPGVEARTAVTPQAISLPDAEGSVEGMGESFAPILSSGTATFSVPIAVAPGRHGVQPSFALSYSSTNGNGSVGFGWGLGVPFISRQVDRGLPRYVDGAAWHPEEDRFLYNGGQELVPVDSAEIAAVDARAADGDVEAVSARPPGVGASWQQYRARVEGAFMRFFRSPDATRWVVQSRDGTRFDFGLLSSGDGPTDVTNASSRSLEADPESPAGRPRVYRWGLTRMSDPHGSTVYYRYRLEGGQSYLEDVHYVSPNSCANADPDVARACATSLSSYGARVRFAYEPTRQDVFASYVSGWRIETGLRLVRIDVSAWNDTVEARTRVRRYHLRYDPSSFHSLLSEVQVEGRPETYVTSLGVSVGRDDVGEDDGTAGRTLPAMRFGYTTMPATGETVVGFGGIDATVRTVAHSPPHSVDDARADLFDVNSDGLPDLIVTDPARYRTREGQPAVGVFFNGFDGTGAVPAGERAHFSDAVAMPMDAGLSGVMTLSNLNIVPMDIDGDGRSDLLHMPRRRDYGFFTPTRAQDTGATPAVSPAQQGWRWTYVPVTLPAGDLDPRIDLGRDSEHLEIVDVNNDHLIDVVRTTGTVMQTWLNLGWLPGGEARFGSYTISATGAASLSTEPIESCLLQSGTAIDFDNPEVRLGDMNGDGLLDVVEMRRGRVRYWPGRGEGSWGDGPHDCARGAGAGRYIEMATPPAELSIELDGVSLMDVNHDGASDIVQVRFDAVDVWFNRAGRGWARRIIARGTPATPSFMPRVRFADIDGSGTTDIVWGTARDWRFVDLAGGQRPRLLTRVENGLGAQTDITYDSSAADYVADLEQARTCTAECFTWGRADGYSERLEDLAGGVRVARSAGSPVISSVVRRVTTSDRLNLLGREAQVSDTRFAYHDGYYEGIEQEFRGFGAADAQSIGDWNHPTSYARTFFQQGRRPQSIADDRLAFNPYEALKGREYLTETFDDAGVYLSSAHATLAIRDLITGLDGRPVQYAFVREANELRYDTAVWTAPGEAIELPDLVRQTWVGSAWSEGTEASRDVTPRAGNFARIRVTYDEVDSLGQVREQTAHGSVGGVWTDEPITSHSAPVLVSGARWLWRTEETWIEGASTGPLGATSNTYSAAGDLVAASQVVSSARTYEFDGEASIEGGALGFTQTDDDLLASTRYDEWGSALASCVGADISAETGSVEDLPTGCLRYARVAYDAVFAQIAEEETTHVATSGVTTLSATGTWDRGLGAVLTATDPNTLPTSVAYDGLGRLVAVVPPEVADCDPGVPTTRIQYELTTDARTSPLSRVITTAQTDCSLALGAEGGSLVSVAYVDGLGRARASLSTGDSMGQWIRGGLSTLDMKGTVRRAYQPDFFTGDTGDFRAVLALPRTASSGSGFPAFGADDIPYTVTRHDAFGRTIGAHAEDGSYTSQSFHALSVDVCDALDNDSSSPFHGTCTTSRSDGHGRVVDQILRTFDSNTGAPEQHRLWSYYRADGVVTDLVRARSTGNRPSDADVRDETDVDLGGSFPWVHRRFYYDTVGRRIGSDDADTDSRDSLLAAGERTWRYLFNEAGDLVAVRDPRGCGQNFFFDLGGRLLGEQYVSCDEASTSADDYPTELVPSGSIAMAPIGSAELVDVRYHYDANPTWPSSVPSHGGGVLGRATGSTDRAQRTAVAYDKRGNAVWTARQIAVIPDARALEEGDPLTSHALDDRPSWLEEEPTTERDVVFDEAHTYVRTARFDHAGRGLAILLPADELWDDVDPAPAIGGLLEFGRRGLPHAVRVTIDCDPVDDDCTAHAGTRPVVSAIDYARDGVPVRVEWGDGDPYVDERMPTESTTEYDIRRRAVRMRTTRAPTGSTSRALESVSVVVDQQLVWDAASNLVEVVDHRDPLEWPAGHRPQTTFVMHDALYRVVNASFSYTQDSGTRTTSDDPTDWRSAQASIRTAGADPMDGRPAPMIQDVADLDGRVQDLSWHWDWLGNTTEWRDNEGAFYERSIGAIGNGADHPTAGLRPSALYISSNIRDESGDPLREDTNGWVEFAYGQGGNVTAMTVHGLCQNRDLETCTDDPDVAPASRGAHLRDTCECRHEQHYQYRWDELNRLSEGRRWDRISPSPDWSLAVRQRYRYDGSNVRAVKQTFGPDDEDDDGPAGAHQERIALYVYAADHEIRGLARSTTAVEYEARAAGHVETQYVVAGARLVWRNVTGGALDEARHRRLTAALTDVIQTTAATLDLETGALVEASTYYPNGARATLQADSDPSATEPMGFTGKESDDEVGLTYFGERYLISRSGRWASPDPLHVHAAGGGEALNAYHYVAGSTLQARDPLGLNAIPPPPPRHAARAASAADRGTTALGRLTAVIREFGDQGVRGSVDAALSTSRDDRPGMGTHFGGWTERSASGFRGELDDSVQNPSSANQVGHFLTAVDHAMNGLDPVAQFATGLDRFSSREAAMRLDIAHELSSDRRYSSVLGIAIPGLGVLSLFDQARAAAGVDYTPTFELALRHMSDRFDPNGSVDMEQLQTDLGPLLAGIAGCDECMQHDSGNSSADLMLTAMGWHFAEMVQAGRFESAEQAAAWIERNVGAQTALPSDASGGRGDSSD